MCHALLQGTDTTEQSHVIHYIKQSCEIATAIILIFKEVKA